MTDSRSAVLACSKDGACAARWKDTQKRLTEAEGSFLRELISTNFRKHLQAHPLLAAIAMVVVASLIHQALPSSINAGSPPIGFFIAVVVAAWLGGLWPGLLATVGSVALTVFYFLVPEGSIYVTDSGEIIRTAFFALEGVVVSLLFESIHRSRAEMGRAIQQAQEARRAAEQSAQAKKHFISNMSHEIRTPLSAILGFTDLIVGSELSADEKSEYHKKVKANAAALSHLIDDILNLSSFERGGLKVKKEPIGLVAFLEQLDHEFRPLAREKGLKLTFKAKGPIPSSIETDKEKLHQILSHLIGNAIKFTHEGTVTVTVAARSPSRPRRDQDEPADASQKLAFIVKDQGIGIAPAQAKELFEPFSQADASRTRKFGGTGIGLVLTRRLARLLGGTVKLVSSQPGQGTTFLLTVDVGDLEGVELIRGFELQPEVVAKPQPVSLEGVKVLLVEDSPDNCVLISRYLRAAGAEVEVANNGRDGVTKAETGDYSVVVMDIQMPELDGNGAAKELREHNYSKPLIALSAHSMREDREEALKSGFNDYLLKPVNKIDLVTKIDEYTREPELAH